ncbi:MAG: hypothetical protein O7A67_05075, partial [SAR324 cluster bacterium]|nr:hypothetical protein [SAR324 cluster bacterium]
MARWPLAALLAAAGLLLLGACDLIEEESSGSKKAPFTTTNVLSLGTSNFEFDTLLAEVPKKAKSIGIVSIGTNRNIKLVDHGCFITVGGESVFMRGPKGIVPYSFNLFDLN